jgi:hypothetical protein
VNRRAAALVLAGTCLAALIALAWWRFGARRAEPIATTTTPSPSTGVSAATGTAAPPSAELPTWVVRLYFPGQDGLLYPEAREIHAVDDAQARLRALLAALLAGPQDPALAPPLPQGVEIDAAFLSPAGVAYLGLRSQQHDTPPSMGSQAEMATVYSLVDSVALNLPAAQRVVLLWNGAQPESFGGHLDTSHPLSPNASLLAHPAPTEATPPPAQ